MPRVGCVEWAWVGVCMLSTVTDVEASFYRSINAKDRRPWVARVGKMRVDGSILGSSVGDELPHDLVTVVVERDLGIVDGFFATVAAGGTFRSKPRSGSVPARRSSPIIGRVWTAPSGSFMSTGRRGDRVGQLDARAPSSGHRPTGGRRRRAVT